ncbi:MAG: ATP-binding protein [Veillonellales bacterium]
MSRSIFSKLLLSHIAVILISTITLGMLMTFLIRQHVVENKRDDLMQKGSFAIALMSPALGEGRMPSDATLKILGDLVGSMMWLSDRDETILAGKPPERWLKKGAPPDVAAKSNELFAGTPQSWVRTSHHQADPSIVIALPVPGMQTPTALFLYAPITGVNKTIDALEQLLFYALLLGIAIAAAVGLFMSRGLTKPIAAISRAAHNFAKGNYESRIHITNDDEIGSLGNTFNNMAASLAHTEQNRRDFLANVSHELKTPVASIQALTEAIQDGLVTTPEQQQRYLNSIVSETHRIDRLIRDLLDMAQLEAGELGIVKEKINLALFLPAELEKQTPLLAEKNLFLDTKLPSFLPAVWADPDRLAQVLLNLLSNAIRYAPANTSIGISIHPDGSSMIAITVSNRGHGIPAADLPYIWDRFYRVEKSRSRKDGGTGLGLAITKKLVVAMGGDISVKSIPEEETTFTFTLPVVLAE